MDFALDETGKVVSTYVPNLLGALAILVVGWLVARIIAALVAGALRRTQLDNKLARWIAGDNQERRYRLKFGSAERCFTCS